LSQLSLSHQEHSQAGTTGLSQNATCRPSSGSRLQWRDRRLAWDAAGSADRPPTCKRRRLLWFDTVTGLNDDNSCAGCHSPTTAFADTQSIAIGIENNGVVGPNRAGPRNMRRAPSVLNAAFFPRLMWNSRFEASPATPSTRAKGFFSRPGRAFTSYLPHLLTAQAFIPRTETNEVAGFHFRGEDGCEAG
jgi:cytochrome c peroxidase